jgi:Electron transfer DM13
VGLLIGLNNKLNHMIKLNDCKQIGVGVAIALCFASPANAINFTPDENTTVNAGENPASVNLEVTNGFTNTLLLAQTIARVGSFSGIDKPTEGSVYLMTENGRDYLSFDEAFKTEEGSDVFVLLHKQEMPSTYNADDFIVVGALQQFSGAQSYPIPSNADLGDFRSVVIWSRELDVVFAYAPLVRP